MPSYWNRLTFMAARWLMRRAWGRRVLWNMAVQMVRAKVRRLLRDIAELLPQLVPVFAEMF